MQCPWCMAPSEPGEQYCYHCGGAIAPGGTGPSAPRATDATQAMPTAGAAPAGVAGDRQWPPSSDQAPTAVMPTTPSMPPNGPPTVTIFDERGRGGRPPGWLAGALLGVLILAGIGLFLLTRGTGEQSTTSLPPSPSLPEIVSSPTAAPGPTVTSTIAPTPSLVIPPTPTDVPLPSVAPEPSAAPEPVGTEAPAITATPTPAPPPTTPTTPPPPPMTPGAITIANASATTTRPGSTDACNQPTDYSASNLIDGNPSTAWMAAGDGTGAQITLRFNGNNDVSFVGLIAGYAKVDPCTGNDRFTEMRRIRRVRWTFSNGTSFDQELNVDNREMQTMRLAAPVRANSVKLTILETVGPGSAVLNHTPISDVVVGRG